jgi:hypothetical protein
LHCFERSQDDFEIVGVDEIDAGHSDRRFQWSVEEHFGKVIGPQHVSRAVEDDDNLRKGVE